MSQLDPIVNGASLYKNGLTLSNDATTPNTKVDVAAGICRDSNNMIDITLGNYLGVNTSLSANTATIINLAATGINALDTGALAASSWYYVFAVADSSNKLPSGAIASLSATAPLLPFGYDSIRCIGAILSDASSHVLKFYQTGNYFQWDAPITVTVTASGTSSSYSAMDLSTGVPVSKFGKAYLQWKWTPAAAANVLNFQPAGATGDAFTILGIVASVAQQDAIQILPLLSSSLPKVSYKVSAGTLNSFQVQAFDMAL